MCYTLYEDAAPLRTENLEAALLRLLFPPNVIPKSHANYFFQLISFPTIFLLL